MSFAAMMLAGLLIDALIGWPSWLFKRIKHPVTWMGWLVDLCDRKLNKGMRAQQLIGGVLTTIALILATALPAYLLQTLLPANAIGILVGGILAWPFIAARAMHEHVQAVARPLLEGDLPAARQAVSMIVGRNPEALDQQGIARAAIESLAENTSDGITAPLFWGCIFGLPGIAAYKAINTMDSMIGHRTPRFEAFGKAAALLDDLVNLLPARITGFLFAVASFHRFKPALKAMRQDAHKHRSPNAGWPEAAMAGALDVSLSGPRSYDGHITDEPYVNPTAPPPLAQTLAQGLSLFRRTMALTGLALLALSLV
ncbi:adenosylcobinamide-phosphate synthase CbiB [Lentibacter algarum]|uniref:adenosylcobinamide-phosphate synthase CbiB n=1 Tax=Lentibacter algarum TaxID=576131 RepID=UPI001C07A8A7|nr:adenosylcobinamide-phosphate synthase CbiB [Lentibacter algarum]MBU2981664.1 adenosylcobinamide-phosphate synthase CbiB [Lentibacter algarum]